MFCTRCGSEIEERHVYCWSCGTATGRGNPSQSFRPAPRLVRDMSDKKIAGVCSGFANYLGVDATLMRLIVLLIAVSTGIGFIAYLIAWIVMPRSDRVPAIQMERAAG